MREIASYEKDIRKGWEVCKNAYCVEEETGDETLFTLANGYIGIRGSLELEGTTRDMATYIAGLYDKNEVPPIVKNRGYVKNKAITPAYAIVPDSNAFTIRAENCAFDFINCKVLNFKRRLDLYRGILFHEYELENIEKRIVRVKTMRIVSAADKHLAYYKAEVTPVNFSEKLSIEWLDTICTYPQTIRRLNDYICKTNFLSAEEKEGVCTLVAQVNETKEKIFLLSSTTGDSVATSLRKKNGIGVCYTVEAKAGECYTFTKRCAYYTSRDDLKNVNLPQVSEEELISEHIHIRVNEWKNADVVIDGDDEIQLGLRWNIFNLLQVADPTNADVSISATGLHGQGYFGHIFWDTEIFIIPFYLATNPKEAEALLRYRFNRLAQAKEVAKKEGCIGAKFPWTSTYTGNDVTPPDWAESSNREIHIAGAVAFGMYNYYLQTGDYAFYKECGIETIVETAKYYASRSTLEDDSKYHLLDVTGPDEYNIHVKDNYYTNYLAKWNMLEAVSAMEYLKTEDVEQYEKIVKNTQFEEYSVWLKEVAEKMAFPQTRDGVNEQFDGFFNLKDCGGFERDEFGMPKDRKRVFDSGLQELKQPDVVMLHYLFPDDFSEEEQKASFAYYENRCKHGSSLSPSIHCVVGLRNGFEEHAYGYLYLTALLDLKNLHLDKNLYEGIHIACAAGTWSAVVYGFGGIVTRHDDLHINPCLPKQWNNLSFKFLHRGVRYTIKITQENFTVSCDKDTHIFVKGERHNLLTNKEYTFEV